MCKLLWRTIINGEYLPMCILPVQYKDQPPGLLWKCPLFPQSDGSPSPPNHSPGPVYTWEAGMQRKCRLHAAMSAEAFLHEVKTNRTVTYALMASVTDPIWLTLRRRQLQAFSSTARCILRGFVTVRSSPTTCREKSQKIWRDILFFCKTGVDNYFLILWGYKTVIPLWTAVYMQVFYSCHLGNLLNWS